MTELIQWPRSKYWEKPWNPIIGCEPVSPACEHCYARAMVSRFNMTGVNAPDFKPTWKKNSKPPKHGVVFCGNMTDLFGEWVPPCASCSYIAKAIDASGDGSAFLWLTKRARRMADALGIVMQEFIEKGWLDNHYFGFTAENEEWFMRRLEDTEKGWGWPKWANMWISFEPLLGPVDVGPGLFARNYLKWCVMGCESGPKRRPCRMEWVENIVEQCQRVNVPVFVKQLDLGGRCVTDIEKFPEHLRVRQVPWGRAPGGARGTSDK